MIRTRNLRSSRPTPFAGSRRMSFPARMVLIPGLALSATASVGAQSPTTPARSADQVLVGSRITSGGYGGPAVRFTRLSGDFAVLAGGRGGWIINRHFVLGGAGFGNGATGVATGFRLPSGREAGLTLGYGGVDLGWVSQPMRLVHLTVATLIGGGGVGYRNRDQDENDRVGGTDRFLVLEPQAALELNVAPHVRIEAGASYRWTDGARLATVGDADLRGVAGTLTFKFGRF